MTETAGPYVGGDITVIIPAHNCEKFIAEAIAGIEAQTVAPKEIIVVENASVDETPNVIRTILGDSKIPVRLFGTRCPGVSNARNIGFSLAETPLIAMLDADDLYLNGFLERALEAFNAIAGLSLFFANRVPFSSSGEEGLPFFQGTGLVNLRFIELGNGIRIIEDDLFSVLLKGCFVPPSGSVLAKEAAYEAGLFPVGLKSSEDRKFFCRLALMGKAAYTNEVLHRYRVHEDSATQKFNWAQQKRNSVLALLALRAELSDVTLGKIRFKNLNAALNQEIASLLYAGADSGLRAFMTEIKWLRSKNLWRRNILSIYGLLKAIKNGIGSAFRHTKKN